MTSQHTEKLTKLPAVPKLFGDDGGKFYKYYDELADELDEDMVTNLKSQLDGILIFAGLFAGVNSAFLAFTLPQMSADPADDTNALLFQIMRGTNGTITSPADLPSASFSPPSGALPINILFSMSLTLALLGSFLAVLGQQWLVYYRKRSGGGAEHQRWEQLRRYLGAKRWRLELVLDDVLPSVLQIALVIFCVAFILYLGTLNKSLCYAIATPLCVAGALILALAIFAAWDHWCPFKSPLSHLFQPMMQYTIEILGKTVAFPASFIYITFKWLGHRFNSGDAPFAAPLNEPDVGGLTEVVGFKDVAWCHFRTTADWFKTHSKRSAQPEDRLKLIALKRVLCTSEDSNALVHAATNAQTIDNRQLIKQIILDDEEFSGRLANLSLISSSRYGDSTLSTIQAWATTTSWIYVILSAGSVEDFLHPDSRASLEKDLPDEDYASQLMTKLSQNLHYFAVYLNAPLPTEYPDGLHYAISTRCAAVVIMTISIDFLKVLVSGYDGRGEPRASLGDPTSLGYAWVEAWAIQLSNDWYGRKGEISIPDGAYTWRLNKLRLFLQTYREIDGTKVVQIICDAIATSAFDWDKRPGHGIYVALFERVMDIMSGLTLHIRCLAVPLKALVILLRAIEKQIRDSATSIEERQSERQYRRRCTEKLITFVRDTYCSTNKVKGWMEPDFVTKWSGPLWFHCVEASNSLQDYLQWIKGVIQSDPSNPDNPLSMRLSKGLGDCLPLPDEVEGRYQETNERDWPWEKAWKDMGKVQSYRQFYSAFMETIAEIDSIVLAGARSTSESSTAGPRPMQDILLREDKTSRIYFEWCDY